MDGELSRGSPSCPADIRRGNRIGGIVLGKLSARNSRLEVGERGSIDPQTPKYILVERNTFALAHPVQVTPVCYRRNSDHPFTVLSEGSLSAMQMIESYRQVMRGEKYHYSTEIDKGW